MMSVNDFAPPDGGISQDELARRYVGREAIVTEKGVIRARVTGVTLDRERRQLRVDVQEVPTPGLPMGLLGATGPRSQPLRWHCGCDDTGAIYEYLWSGGVHFNWTIHFREELVRKIAQWAGRHDGGNSAELYREATVLVEKFRGPIGERLPLYEKPH